MRVVAAVLLRSRETQIGINAKLRDRIEKSERERDEALRRCEEQQREIEKLRQQVRNLEKEVEEARSSVNLPADPPLVKRGYGPRMVSLAVNLAKSVGFRGAARVLKLFFAWLGIDQRTPSRNTIRNWMQRIGIAELNSPLPDTEDLVIMADHSMQLGTEKVLVILGVNASDMPPRGEALKHEHVRVLTAKPGSQWKTEDMEREYKSLADRMQGAPRAVISDAAPELQEGAKCLLKRRDGMIILGDFKHFAANTMKAILGKERRFEEVLANMGSTRAAIQQTTLAPLAPPAPKLKSRFMNLKAIINWMMCVNWLARTPEADAHQDINDERFQDKLGWVMTYEDEIRVWQECQDVVSTCLTFINEHGVFKGASEEMRRKIGDLPKHEQSKEVAKRLIEFVLNAEQQLRDGERVLLTTEILESGFGLYKQLERQHSKSGFTSLLACFPALLKTVTPELVSEAFQRVSRNDVDAWIKENFPSTVSSRRRSIYAEYRKATKRATEGTTVT